MCNNQIKVILSHYLGLQSSHALSARGNDARQSVSALRCDLLRGGERGREGGKFRGLISV